MYSRQLCRAALATVLAACGSEEMFQLELGSTERPVSAVTVAQITGDDRIFDQPVVVGDLDGDGISDALVAGITYDKQAHIITDVYVIYGGSAVTGTISLGDLPHLSGLGAVAQIASLGDVDGDGLADFLVSSEGPPNNNPSPRGGYLVYGSATRLTGATPVVNAGVLFSGGTSVDFLESFSSLGDLDGDGLADFAIAGPSSAGQPATVFVFYGSAIRRTGTVDVPTGADAAISVPTDTGCRVMGMGDVDGNHRPDFMIKAEHRDGSGGFAADLHLVPGRAGRLAGTVALSEVAATQFSAPYTTTALALGDLDGDGIDDFAIGGEGSYGVFYGRAGGFPASVAPSSADAALSDGEPLISVAALDRGAPGHRDLVVGEPLLHARNGAVHLVHPVGARLSGAVDLSHSETYVGVPRHADNCTFATSSNCTIQEGLGYAFASGAITGGGHPDLLVTDTDSGVTPQGVHDSSFVRLYVLALPDHP